MELLRSVKGSIRINNIKKIISTGGDKYLCMKWKSRLLQTLESRPQTEYHDLSSHG
jgi:hypothetical protein